MALLSLRRAPRRQWARPAATIATVALASALVVAVTTPVAASSSASETIRPTVGCASLAALDLSRLDARVTAAVPVTRSGHRYCDVHGYISPQTQFEVLLPEATWRGDYLQQGCGGLCGHVDVSLLDPSRTSGYQAPFAPLRNGEMVVAADDQGHETLVNSDGLWGKNDPQLRVVYGYSSEHQLAQTAKAITGAFYGRGPSYSYYSGVSDGGHEALDLAQRYPTDFDGILAGAPANNLAPLFGLVETWQIVANMDRAGHQILTSEKLPALHAAVLAACADRYGVIRDPRACTFRPSSLACPAGVDNARCLTPAQVGVVRKEYRGPTDPQGRSLFNGGQPYGSELAWNGWLTMPAGDRNWPADTIAAPLALNYLQYLAYWHNPPQGFGLRDVQFTDATYHRLQILGGIYNATDPDLSAFRAHGGKLIIYHGWADQAIPPFTSINYYRAVVRQMGGYTATQSFSRLYLIPGLYHCPCGEPVDGDPATTVQLLPQLTRWVEQGGAPGTVRLPVTAKTAGRPLGSITVDPENPLYEPQNNGLNSHYDYIGKTSTYRPGNELWCRQDGPRLVCSHRQQP